MKYKKYEKYFSKFGKCSFISVQDGDSKTALMEVMKWKVRSRGILRGEDYYDLGSYIPAGENPKFIHMNMKNLTKVTLPSDAVITHFVDIYQYRAVINMLEAQGYNIVVSQLNGSGLTYDSVFIVISGDLEATVFPTSCYRMYLNYGRMSPKQVYDMYLNYDITNRIGRGGIEHESFREPELYNTKKLGDWLDDIRAAEIFEQVKDKQRIGNVESSIDGGGFQFGKFFEEVEQQLQEASGINGPFYETLGWKLDDEGNYLIPAPTGCIDASPIVLEPVFYIS